MLGAGTRIRSNRVVADGIFLASTRIGRLTLIGILAKMTTGIKLIA